MLNAIHAKNHSLTIPIQFIVMELCRGGTNCLSCGVESAAKAGGGVHGAWYMILIVAPVLHNIYLATGWPYGIAKALGLPVGTSFIDVFTQRPDRWPGANATWQFCANYYASILKGIFGIEASRGELFGAPLVSKWLFYSNDFQGTIADIRILDAVGVMLLFIVIPATAIRKLCLVKPFAWINSNHRTGATASSAIGTAGAWIIREV